VWGDAENAPEALADMLDEVLNVVRERNADTGNHDGILVILEELQDVRAAASKTTRARIDVALGRIVRMGRAVGVHVLVSTQRPTVDDVPSGVRNLITQRVALITRNAADTAIVLGVQPTGRMPAHPGQAFIATPQGVRGVVLDHLDDVGWALVVAHATAARPPVTRGHTEPEAETDAQPDLLGEARHALEAADGGMLSPADLLATIGPAVGITSAPVLAKRLAAVGLSSRALHAGRRYTLVDAIDACNAARVPS
jgi:hypothetical protein